MATDDSGNDPILCGSCGKRIPTFSLTEDEYNSLSDQHYYEGFVEELRMLHKVRAYYRRHPEAEGTIKPHFARALESDDPHVIDQLVAGVPFDEIKLPDKEAPCLTDEDAEVVEYLRHNEFALYPRLNFISERVATLKESVGAVACPYCNYGRLRVPPEDWAEFIAGDETNFYWPHWHGFDDDGTLHVKATGYTREGHWTGEQIFKPDHQDYAFWRWLVAQPTHHRVVNETDLPAIRKAWERER
jgi:DNA-directed RNA polymerase subunit RPC12/RpoP